MTAADGVNDSFNGNYARLTGMSRRCRVVYVDGEEGEQAADAFEDAAERLEVHPASTAEDALDLLATESVDCVVATQSLPDSDALALLDRVRERFPGIPFVLYPESGSEVLASGAVGADVSGDVPKSAGEDGDRLVGAVCDAIDAAGRTRRAERVVNLVRTIQSALVRARTADEIDSAVCETIVETEPYAFAWIGEYDEADERVTPRASAGIEAGYLEAIEIATDDSQLGCGPTGRAVATRTTQMVQNISEEPRYEPWREEALERTYRSSAAVPLVHEETLYGVLNVYADQTYAFDDEERALLSDLGETIAHALHRVRLEEEYRSQYRQLFEEAPVMVALTRDEGNGPIIDDCNRQFADKLGWERGDLRDRPLADVYTAESARKLLEQNGYERALAGEFVTAERTLSTRTGDRLTALLQATPRRNIDGEIVGTHALYVDMTERKQAREVLGQVEAMEASIDGIGITDENGEFVYANQAYADIYGYDDPEAFLGNSWRMLYEDEEIDRFDAEIRPVLDAGSEWRGEATGVRADGSTFPQELSLTPLSNGHHIGVVRDITKRRRDERRLERQRDNLEILNQVVRHDIRNDLQIVLGYAEILPEFVDEDGADHVERVLNSTRDAIEITETAGDVAEVMLSADTETKPVGIRYVLNDQIIEVRSSYEDVILTTDGTIPNVNVLADGMLGSVFRNLLTNAIVHNDAPLKDVTVSASVTADTVVVRIADNGPGIPDDRKEVIFEDSEKGLDSEGTGLGLYLVEMLIDRYGGDVWVEDNDPRGSVFVVELPVSD